MAPNLPAARPRRTEQGEQQGALQGVCALLPPDSLVLGAGGVLQGPSHPQSPTRCREIIHRVMWGHQPRAAGWMRARRKDGHSQQLWRAQATLVSHPAVPQQPSHAPTSLQGEFPSPFDVTNRLL